MAFSPTLTILSLGGGVQSSVMALMASAGGFDRIPDCTIFADTRWEPPSIYEHLEWLSSHLTFPMYVVDNGRSLREDVKALTNHSGSRNYVDIPVYLKGHAGEGDGIGRRQCTDNYKIRPIRRRIRELLGLKPRQRVPNGTTVELWLGISTDEAIHMRTSRDSWMTNRYPLIEAGMSRKDCADWWVARYDRPLERSACVACPFQSRQRWVETKRRWPELFAEVVEIDAKLRDGRRQEGTLRHHRLLEVRPTQPGHVPRRRPHGGRRGVPDRAGGGHGRHRHEDLRPHGGHRQDRAGQLPGEGLYGQARLGQAGPHPRQQRPLRLPPPRGPQAAGRGGRGRGNPPRLPHVRPRRAGGSGHCQAVDRRGRPHAQSRRAMVRPHRHSHPGP